MKLIVALIFLFIPLLVGGCDLERRPPPEAISEEAARAVLDQAILHALARDFDSLCHVGFTRLGCQQILQMSGGVAAVPQEPPRIIDTYIFHDDEEINGSAIMSGRVFVLEGVDGLGNAYRTEFLVFDTGMYGLKAYIPIFWWSFTLNPEMENIVPPPELEPP